MKKRILKTLSLLGASFVFLPLLSGCSTAEDNIETINLRVLNCEDYIGEDDIVPFWDEAEEESYAGVLEAFSAYEWEVNHKKVNVIYDTFDTNETMLSSLKTGKSTYDLICPSDYTIQKMMSLGMLEPFDEGALPNYDAYVSKYLLGKMKEIKAENGDGSGELHEINEYAKGYMWGTLGITYNPALVAKTAGISEEEVKYDMNDWNSLWDKKYKGIMSIKDSMRDTYSVGIMRLFDKEIREEMEASGYFTPGSYELKEDCYDDALANYSPKLATDFFNKCDEETVKKVEKVLLELKGNVFGFEVDSGKDDIVKGLVGMNLAWSGDAVYSLDRAEHEADQTLYYSVPKTGGNIWFDGWVMPKSDSLHKAEAQEFVDFLSHPAIATADMSSIGYTSFIAGDYVHDLIRQWYDPRSYAMYVYHDATNDPDSTWEDSDFVYDDEENIVFQDGTGVHPNGDDYGPFDMTGSSYEAAVVDGVAMSWEEYQEKYNSEVAESEDEEIEWTIVNLSYVFQDTLSEDVMDLYGNMLGEEPDTNPYYFYSDEYETIADPKGEGEDVVVGRQFFTQYVPQEFIPKLAAMNDYGANNKYVLTMWQNVKGNNLPLWGVIVFGIILLGALSLLGVSIVLKIEAKKIKVARRKEVANRIAVSKK